MCARFLMTLPFLAIIQCDWSIAVYTTNLTDSSSTRAENSVWAGTKKCESKYTTRTVTNSVGLTFMVSIWRAESDKSFGLGRLRSAKKSIILSSRRTISELNVTVPSVICCPRSLTLVFHFSPNSMAFRQIGVCIMRYILFSHRLHPINR